MPELHSAPTPSGHRPQRLSTTRTSHGKAASLTRSLWLQRMAECPAGVRNAAFPFSNVEVGAISVRLLCARQTREGVQGGEGRAGVFTKNSVP